jgi:hypothetical protein
VDGQLIDVIARHIGMSIGLLDTTADELSPGPRRAGAKPAADSGGRSIIFHDPDGAVLIDGDYIIRGVAGRILFAMLSEYQRSGRTRSRIASCGSTATSGCPQATTTWTPGSLPCAGDWPSAATRSSSSPPGVASSN